MLTAVKRSLLAAVCVALSCMPRPASAQPGTAQPLPGLPSKDDPVSTPSRPPPAATETLTPQQLYERFRRGVVAVERNGVPVAIGTLLGGDGRILTALSGLGGADGADVRYADGTAVHTKIGHSDKEQDLVLLVPQSGKRTDGLIASDADPMRADLRALLPMRGARLGPAEADVRGRADAHARGGEPLLQMLDVDLKGPPVVGAPLLDATGRVVAVLVRACKGPSPQSETGREAGAETGPSGAWPAVEAQPAKAAPACLPVIVGAPVSAIRTFLLRTPAAAATPAPWLGIRGEPESSGGVHGVRVKAVAPSSPAEKAGLKPSMDVIVAVDGLPIDTPEKLADAIGKHGAGDAVKLLVFGGDKLREVSVILRLSPQAQNTN
jgi:serine protease Do